jgi:hypothetical protein
LTFPVTALETRGRSGHDGLDLPGGVGILVHPMILKCENCGARLPRLNFTCSYCNHWTVDPAHPLPNPAYATTPAAPPAAPAPASAAPAPAAPAAPAVMTPLGGPVVSPANAAEKTAAKPTAEGTAKHFGIRRTAPAPAVAAKGPARVIAQPAKGAVKVEVAARTPEAASKADLFRAAMGQSGEVWAKAKAVRGKGVAAVAVSDEDEAAVAHAEAVAAAVYYVCTADDDDEMDVDEYDALVGTLGELLGTEADEDALEDTIARWDEAMEEDWDAFFAEVAEAIGDERGRRDALMLAVIAAAADGELGEYEEQAAYDVGAAFGFDEDASERLIERALRKAG